ncbi:MAG: immunoglobulin domain-containing protein [Verrucomicrobiota bacterium]
MQKLSATIAGALPSRLALAALLLIGLMGLPVCADLGNALNASNLVWSTGGAAGWYPQTTNTHDGVAAVQSGSILDNQESWLETTVTNAGILTFWWMVSSETDYDFLEFYLDGSLTNRISGVAPWQQQAYSLGAGVHTLHWRYVKDAGGSFGADAAWLDQLSFLPESGSPVIAMQPVGLTNLAGTVATFRVVASGGAPLTYQWLKYVSPTLGGNPSGSAIVRGPIAYIFGATNSTLMLSNLSKADNAAYSVVIANSQGSVTSATAVLTVSDPAITLQPASLSVDLGKTAVLTVAGAGTLPLRYRWFKDGVTLASQTNSSLTITNLHLSDAADYSVVLSNRYGSVTSVVARLAVNRDTLAFSPVIIGNVQASAYQPDGKLLVVGTFTSLDNQPRNRIARLNVDGTVDLTFDPGANAVVNAVAVQPDGKILVAGSFTALGGQPRNRIGRLNADGSLDTSFNSDANYTILVLAMQADGKILVAGEFTKLDGQPRNRIGRLNADGTLDTTFNPSANNWVASLVLQPDGKILVGGMFTQLCDQSVGYLGRLNAEGSLDLTFTPKVNDEVFALALQPDGKILVGGSFTWLAGQRRPFIGRLSATGALDATFDPGADASVSSLLVLADGRIRVNGYFSKLSGQPVSQRGRLFSDGSLDKTYDVKVNAGFIRLNGSKLDYTDLNYDGTTITWLRQGNVYDIWRTTFESSTNEADWVSLGSGVRNGAEWQLAGVSVPAGAWIRARGYSVDTAGGGIIQSTIKIGSPAVTMQPVASTNYVGSEAVFSVLASGTTPLAYQWYKGGKPIVDTARITGTSSARLTVTSLSKSDADNYSVVITNAYGAVTSAVAALKVIDPVVTAPVIVYQTYTNVIVRPGQTTNLQVVAQGLEPLSYRWTRSGYTIQDTNQPTLLFPNVSVLDAGIYRVIVSNSLGSVTSAPITLTVDAAVPVLVITTPLTNVRVTNAMVVVLGRVVNSGSALAGVYYSLNNAGFRQADSTTNWHSTLTNWPAISTNWYTTISNLVPGTNLLTFYSADFVGNVSLVRKLTVFYVHTNNLTVLTGGTGLGKVTPYASTNLEVGKNYTLIATPQPGSLLSNWVCGGTVLTNGPTLRLLLRSNTTVQANFVTNAFLARSGDYVGLFSPSNLLSLADWTNSGTVKLTVTTRGTFTGQLTYQGTVYPIAGAFDAGGYSTNSISRNNDPDLSVALSLDLSHNDGVTGSVTLGTNWLADLLAAAVLKQTQVKTNYSMTVEQGPPIFAPRVIPGQPHPNYVVISQLGGSINLAVQPSGSVLLSGTLADGTKLTGTLPLTVQREVVLYQTLYQGSGMLLGYASLMSTNVGGEVHWQKVPNSVISNGFSVHSRLLFP